MFKKLPIALLFVAGSIGATSTLEKIGTEIGASVAKKAAAAATKNVAQQGVETVKKKAAETFQEGKEKANNLTETAANAVQNLTENATKIPEQFQEFIKKISEILGKDFDVMALVNAFKTSDFENVLHELAKSDLLAEGADQITEFAENNADQIQKYLDLLSDDVKEQIAQACQAIQDQLSSTEDNSISEEQRHNLEKLVKTFMACQKCTEHLKNQAQP